MARGVNKVLLIGYVGKDPDTRTTPKGTLVTSFSFATSESRRDKDGNLQEKTEWHTVVAWSKLAEIVKNYAHKGSRLYIEGKIQYRSYEAANNEKRYVTEILAENIVLLDNKGERKDGGAPDPAESFSQVPDDDDLPF